MADTPKGTTSFLPEMTTRKKRTLAKVGMATSLGTLVATGLMETNRTEGLKKLHIWSGFALVGFSYWHYSLYNTTTKSGGANP